MSTSGTAIIGPPFSEVPDLTGCVVGDSEEITGAVYDARRHDERSARAQFDSEYGMGEAGAVTLKPARWLTRGEQWEYDADVWWQNWLEDHWSEEDQGEPSDAPDAPPDEYEPDPEFTPYWTNRVRPGDAGVVQVYVVTMRSVET